jgi:hypothetical protein
MRHPTEAAFSCAALAQETPESRSALPLQTQDTGSLKVNMMTYTVNGRFRQACCDSVTKPILERPILAQSVMSSPLRVHEMGPSWAGVAVGSPQS